VILLVPPASAVSLGKMFSPGLEFNTWLGLVALVLFYIVGFLHVLHALMNVRTSQGTIAWVISLLAIPFIALPMYWMLGRTRFSGTIVGRRVKDSQLGKLAHTMHQRLRHCAVDIPDDDAFERAAQVLGGLPFTRGNELELLIDGDVTFERIFETIREAKHYLCVNFFIVKNDRLGTRFQEALIERAKAGVKVYFLFDEIGSHKLSRKYLKAMKEAGIECLTFGINRYWWSRLQLNFRNHRKIVVADGETAFIGGLNVGDEYLGRDQRFGGWRDTHLKMRGPVVQAVQLVFLEDWYWASNQVPELHWDRRPEPADQIAAIIPTGPADPADSWQLVVAEAANTARKKLWIASPYFVPDEGVLTALQTAAIRGVDVRILLPERADHLLVWLSAFSYYQQSIPYGVKLYRYHKGFLHQKVMLIDERLAAVGTANLDNRSFRLNFEITGFSTDKKFVSEVEAMLVTDFSHSTESKVEDFTGKSFLFRAACRGARLLAPIQ
jgi:cardiolipin synthase